MNARNKPGKKTIQKQKDHQIGDLVCIYDYESKYRLGIIVDIENIILKMYMPQYPDGTKVYSVNVFDPNIISGKIIRCYKSDLFDPNNYAILNGLEEKEKQNNGSDKKKRKKKEISNR